MEKSLGINALLLPNYKKHFEAKKNRKEMDFQMCKFMLFLVHPTMHLPDPKQNSFCACGMFIELG
jgi:hypothetical protein